MNDTTTTTKVTKLTGQNVSALDGWAEDLKVSVGKTTATFEGTATEAATRLRAVQEKIAAVQGRKAGAYAALHAVARKLDALAADEKDAPAAETEQPEAAPAPKLTLVADSTDPASLVNIPGLGRSVKAPAKAEDKDEEQPKSAPTKPNAAGDLPRWGTAKFHGLKHGDMFMNYGKDRDAGPKAAGTVRKYEVKNGTTTVGGVATRFWAAPIVLKVDQEAAAASKPEKAAPGKKAAPAKKTAGTRAIPQEAANKVRAAWIKENGLDLYKRHYNGGWDNATYGTGEKKAASGEASPAYMDGYTDRKANPGKEGITAKWSALKSTEAPVKKA